MASRLCPSVTAAANVDPDDLVGRSRTSLFRAAAAGCGDDEVLIEDECPIYGDRPRDMTSGRLVARFLSRYRWYYPRRRSDDDAAGGGPDLDAAWAHYEHWTLARYYLDCGDGGGEGDGKRGAKYGGGGFMVRAKRGEKDRPTALYPIWATPVSELADFGVSVRMYFYTLLALSSFLFVAGTLNLPLAAYFKSYGTKDGIDNRIMGSAICDDTEWVECESCNDNNYADMYPSYRLDGANARKNACNFDDWLVPGLLGYASTIVLLASFGIWFYHWQRRAEVEFDEDVQTASDYTVKVTNPPPDATDPEEWRHFMQRFVPRDHGGVVACTVALDNRELLAALVKRRRMLKDLAKLLPYGTDMSDDAAIAEAVHDVTMERNSKCRMSLPFLPGGGPEDKYAKIKILEGRIQDLTQREYRAVAVFVTFETERGQRNALHALSTGRLNVWKNQLDESKLDGKTVTVHESAQNVRDSSSGSNIISASIKQEEKLEAHTIHLVKSDDSCADPTRYLLFRGQKVLYVKEAPEPDDVRWKDLQVPKKIQAVHVVGTTAVLLAFVCWSGYFINHLVRTHPGEAHGPIFIAVTNLLVPKICEGINKFEPHSTEGGRQSSVYVKMALFRWFNSAIALSIVFGFVETISVEDGNEEGKQSLLYSVAPIIFAELFTVPVIKLLDPVGFLRKHILAPRVVANTQHDVNGLFVGGKFELADLYTDATKIIFVSLFYASVFPPALFLGSIALALHFAVGKFCLLRRWRPTPDVGHHLARLSRNYFFSTALVVHVIMSAYWWSGYPYDHICGDYDREFYYCSQDMFRQGVFHPPASFPTPGGGMDDDQSGDTDDAVRLDERGGTAVRDLGLRPIGRPTGRRGHLPFHVRTGREGSECKFYRRQASARGQRVRSAVLGSARGFLPSVVGVRSSGRHRRRGAGGVDGPCPRSFLSQSVRGCLYHSRRKVDQPLFFDRAAVGPENTSC